MVAFALGFIVGVIITVGVEYFDGPAITSWVKSKVKNLRSKL